MQDFYCLASGDIYISASIIRGILYSREVVKT